MLARGVLLILTIDCSQSLLSYTKKPHHDPKVHSKPWVGVLRHKQSVPDESSQEAATGIVLISAGAALGSAQHVARIDRARIRSTSDAVFVSPGDVPWSCAVVDYTLHEEFHHRTLNTVALVHLEYDFENYRWQLPAWPARGAPLSTLGGDLRAVGCTDRLGVLEQIVYRMQSIELDKCIDFYKREELDMSWLTPAHYRCVTTALDSGRCVFEPGMALVATTGTGTFTLLGMSTLGPGCSLPSRFLTFDSYVPWLEKISITRRALTRRQTAYKDDWSVDEFRDPDAFFLQRLTDSSIILKKVNTSHPEDVQGTCNGSLVLRDDIKLKVEGAGEEGYGTYQMSYLDLGFDQINCVLVNVSSEEKSDLAVWSTQGLDADDIEPYVKRVPVTSRDSTNRPKITQIQDSLTRFDAVAVNHIFFKFKYMKTATLHVHAYGAEAAATRHTTPAGGDTTTATRTRRAHSTHIRPTASAPPAHAPAP